MAIGLWSRVLRVNVVHYRASDDVRYVNRLRLAMANVAGGQDGWSSGYYSMRCTVWRGTQESTRHSRRQREESAEVSGDHGGW